MRLKNLHVTIGLLVMGYLSAALATPQPPTVSEIKKSLVCLCDCNMTVEACQGAMACQSAEKLTAEATQLVEQGLTKEAVLATFINKYGEHILAAPPKKGFNLTAWILPFAAILIAGFGIMRVLRRWARRRQPRSTRNGARKNSKPARDPVYEKKLDEVLNRID